MSDQLKRRLFVATVESVLLYGSEAWTLTVQDEKALNGVYTRMLRMALNISWEDHVKNVDMYGDLPRVTDKIRGRRMRQAGHCVRHHRVGKYEWGVLTYLPFHPYRVKYSILNNI